MLLLTVRQSYLQNKIYRLAFVALMLTLLCGSLFRSHNDYLPVCADQFQADACVESDSQDFYHWDKLPSSPAVLPQAMDADEWHRPLRASLELPTPVVTKSHIEYCGKKMVRAIMLQFRPKV